jgi:hypothetical protein
MEKLFAELQEQLSSAKVVTRATGPSEICSKHLDQVAGGTLGDGQPWYLNDGKGGVGFL